MEPLQVCCEVLRALRIDVAMKLVCQKALLGVWILDTFFIPFWRGYEIQTFSMSIFFELEELHGV